MRTIFDSQAELLDALSHPTRIAIIHMLLEQSEIPLSEIRERVNSPTTFTHQISTLKRSGLIRISRSKTSAMVILNSSELAGTLKSIKAITAHDLEKKVSELKKLTELSSQFEINRMDSKKPD